MNPHTPDKGEEVNPLVAEEHLNECFNANGIDGEEREFMQAVWTAGICLKQAKRDMSDFCLVEAVREMSHAQESIEAAFNYLFEFKTIYEDKPYKGRDGNMHYLPKRYWWRVRDGIRKMMIDAWTYRNDEAK